jgi:hypothetical protein
MTRVPFPVLALLCVAASTSAGELPLRVTVPQLLTTPEKFVGKRVIVTGYHHTETEESSLFASEREARKHWGPENGIWLDATLEGSPFLWRRRGGPAPSESTDGHIVRVIGTFRYEPRPIRDKSVPYSQRYRGYGTYRLWGRAIDNITYFERAK